MAAPKILCVAATAAILAIASSFPAAVFADSGSDLPRAMALTPPQEKPNAGPEQEPPPPPAVFQQGAPAKDFFDLGRLELTPRLTLVSYSSDFDSDPKFGGGALLRAPLPWLSQDVLGLKEADLGGFASVTVSTLNRDDKGLPDVTADGTVFFLGLGLDYAFYRDETFSVAAQFGVEYAQFGGIDGTDSGTGLLLGLSGGIKFAEGFWATLNPQVSIGRDQIFFVHLGVTIAF